MNEQQQPKIKIVANAVEGKAHAQVLTGNHFHKLQGTIQQQYETNSLDYMKSFLIKYPKENGMSIYYDDNSIVAYLEDMEIGEGAIAVCRMQNSTALQKILENVNHGVELKEFEEFLLSMKKKLNKNGIELLSMVKNFKISKITNIERQKDQQGNYMYKVSRTGTKEDVVFPEEISFTCRMFKYHNYDIELDFDVHFDFIQNDDVIKIYFKLVNYELGDVIQDRKIDVIGTELKEFSNVYWGNNNIIKITDSWKYLDNAMTT